MYNEVYIIILKASNSSQRECLSFKLILLSIFTSPQKDINFHPRTVSVALMSLPMIYLPVFSILLALDVPMIVYTSEL
jgi:hypothetical protein